MGNVPTPIDLGWAGSNCDVGCIRISIRDMAQLSITNASRSNGCGTKCCRDSERCTGKWCSRMARYWPIPNAAF